MQPLQPGSFCLQNVSKSGCLLRRASDLFYPRISLARSLSPLSLVSNTHKRAHAHTRRCTQNGRTPLVPRRLLLEADEMKEQLCVFRFFRSLQPRREAESLRGDTSSAPGCRGAPDASVRKMEALRALRAATTGSLHFPPQKYRPLNSSPQQRATCLHTHTHTHKIIDGELGQLFTVKVGGRCFSRQRRTGELLGELLIKRAVCSLSRRERGSQGSSWGFRRIRRTRG